VPGSSRDTNLHVIMAGNGNPYAVMTPERLPLVFHLREHPRIATLADARGISPEAARAELEPLVACSLVTRDGDSYRPTFFIANRQDTALVERHARRIGLLLAQQLLQGWESLERAFFSLRLGAGQSFREHAFMLVGAKLLDIALLDALAEDGTLMPPAPARPSPDQPGARYYFWMVEGDYAQLGRYGQRITRLAPPHDLWELASFGEYVVDGKRNRRRDELHERVSRLSPTTEIDALAARERLPLAGRDDAAGWQRTARQLARGLARIYLEHEVELRALHQSLLGSSERPGSFGEFFCWFDHVAYGAAVDELAAAGKLAIPVERFTAMLWHATPDSGMF
jgi:hypothetical protein